MTMSSFVPLSCGVYITELPRSLEPWNLHSFPVPGNGGGGWGGGATVGGGDGRGLPHREPARGHVWGAQGRPWDVGLGHPHHQPHQWQDAQEDLTRTERGRLQVSQITTSLFIHRVLVYYLALFLSQLF